jgi:signal transduction histidine kinase
MLYQWRLTLMTARAVERMRARLDERERIARTLHDTFLQSVMSLILHFHSIKSVLPKEDKVQKQIDDALDAADAVIEEGREELMDLRSERASQIDLVLAIKATGMAASAQRGVAFTLHEQGARRTLRSDVRDELLAIAKEAIANALQHSGSSEVMAQLSYGAGQLTLAVRDHGAGMDEAVRQSGQRERHWGLTGMHERAARIGAKLAIQSAPGAGTSVVVTLRASLAYC